MKLGTPIQSRKDGEELLYICPFCHHPKLELNKRKGVYHCFRCKASGRMKGIRDQQLPPQRTPSMVQIPEIIPFFWNTPASEFLEERGITRERAQELCLVASTDPLLKNRVIFPIRENGMPAAYTARAWNPKVEPKEIASPGRSLYLYPDINTIREGDDIVLTEGIFDCEAILRQGVKALSTSGSSISDTQVGKIISRRPRTILFFYDGDEAGKKGALLGVKKVLPRTSATVLMASIRGKDPDEASQEELDLIFRFMKNPRGELSLHL